MSGRGRDKFQKNVLMEVKKEKRNNREKSYRKKNVALSINMLFDQTKLLKQKIPLFPH